MNGARIIRAENNRRGCRELRLLVCLMAYLSPFQSMAIPGLPTIKLSDLITG